MIAFVLTSRLQSIWHITRVPRRTRRDRGARRFCRVLLDILPATHHHHRWALARRWRWPWRNRRRTRVPFDRAKITIAPGRVRPRVAQLVSRRTVIGIPRAKRRAAGQQRVIGRRTIRRTYQRPQVHSAAVRKIESRIASPVASV